MATATRDQRRGASFHDRLSRLTYHQACKLLEVEEAGKLITRGGAKFLIDPDKDVYLGGDLLRINVCDDNLPGSKAIVVLTKMTGRKGKLHVRCDQCETACEHAGGALHFLLDETE